MSASHRPDSDPSDLETTGQSPLKLVTHCEDSRGQLELVCPCGAGMGLYSLLLAKSFHHFP